MRSLVRNGRVHCGVHPFTVWFTVPTMVAVIGMPSRQSLAASETQFGMPLLTGGLQSRAAPPFEGGRGAVTVVLPRQAFAAALLQSMQALAAAPSVQVGRA